MKIVLLRSVPKVGKKDEIVEVPEGYARNALFPKGFAIQATENAVKQLQGKIHAKKQSIELEQKLLEDTYIELSLAKVTITVPHTKEGVLFKKIQPKDIVAAIFEQQHKSINAGDIVSTEFPIKHTGEYTFKSKSFPKLSFTVTIE